MNIIKSLQWRYATKKFDDSKTLTEEKLNILKQAFNLTATSFGLQTITMVIVTDKTIRKKLVEHSYNQKQVLDASHLLVICINEDIKDDDVDMLFDSIHSIRNTPETILSPYRSDLKITMQQMSKDERQEWSNRQAYIALGNLMTVCAVENIDSSPMEGFSSEMFDEILKLNKKKLKSVLLLPVGYRAEDDMFASFKKVRKEVDKSVIEL